MLPLFLLPLPKRRPLRCSHCIASNAAESPTLRFHSPRQILATCIFFLRASALILNDILDRKFDVKVPRSRLRPLPRGAITPLQACMWMVVHVLCFIAVMLAGLPEQCLRLSVPHALLHAAYPPAKRFTDFTPFVIGPAWAFGLFVGAAAVRIDPFQGVPWLQSRAAKESLLLKKATLRYGVWLRHMRAGVLSLSLSTRTKILGATRRLG